MESVVFIILSIFFAKREIFWKFEKLPRVLRVCVGGIFAEGGGGGGGGNKF